MMMFSSGCEDVFVHEDSYMTAVRDGMVDWKHA